MSNDHSIKGTNVVLVHGGFVDGSGWESVYKILRKEGYAVSIVQNPTISLADDVAATKLIIDAQNGPVILVGHSYGGVVITEAGNDPKVVGLVYIAAFAPDRGESVSTLIKDPPPGAPVPPGRIHRPARPCRRSCRRVTVIYSLIMQSFRRHLPRTWTRKERRSWPTPRFRGAWARSAAQSANRRGKASRVGIWSPLMTR